MPATTRLMLVAFGFFALAAADAWSTPRQPPGEARQIAAGLHELVIHDPCTGDYAAQPDTCLHERRHERTVPFGGVPGTVYEVTLRVRGIFEPTIIEGGETPYPQHPYFKAGGTVRTRDWSHWHIAVSEPKQTYSLNHYPKVSHTIYQEDFEATIPIAAGATVAIVVVDGNDRQIDNAEHGPSDRQRVIKGVFDTPRDGQMLRLDVVAVKARQDKPVVIAAARPQRTEAEARARADANRRERADHRKTAGAPAELIADYLAANVGPPPEALLADPNYRIDRVFYRKYADAMGIPVLASDKVPDAALLVARDIVNSMLAARPDIRKALIARHWRTGVIAEVEMTMDIPEYSRMKRPGAPRDEPVIQADRDYHANRSRGLGGNPTTGAEENLLGYPGTRYWGEHIFVHEFAHAIMGGGIRTVDPPMFEAIRAAYDKAMAAGQYVHPDGRKHYATTNASEYWAEGVQWWFFSNYGECFAGGIKVETPEEFAAYDPTLNELIGRVFTTHRIPMDVFHARQIRKVECARAP